MSKNRILAFNQSRKLSEKELEDVSAAGMTTYVSGGVTYSSSTGWDTKDPDVTFD